VALDVDDVALHAGVDPEKIRMYRDAGILTADAVSGFRPADIARARLVHGLEQAGMGLDQLARAVEDGRLSLTYVEHLMPDPVRLVAPPTDATGAASLEHERLLEPILGTARKPGDPVREDDLAILRLVGQALELGAPPDRVVRIFRTMAQSAARLTELQRDFVDEVLLAPAIARTGSPIAALEETSPSRLRYRQIGRELTGLLMDRLVDDAIFRNLVDLTERALSDAGIHPTEQDQTMAFIDVSNYTRLSEERGDEESARQAALLVEVVHGLALKHGGRLVKSLGDGALVHASNPRDGLAIAIEAVKAARPAGLWQLHAGVNSGPMVRRDGDFFGAAVNIASRVADEAHPGEVLVTREVVAGVQDDGIDFQPLGESRLENVGTPVFLFRATGTPDVGDAV
jgi:adenylate cyclase